MTVLRSLISCAVAAAAAFSVAAPPPARADDDPNLTALYEEIRAVDPRAGTDKDISLYVLLVCDELARTGYKATGRHMMSVGYSQDQALLILAIIKRRACPNVVDPPFAS